MEDKLQIISLYKLARGSYDNIGEYEFDSLALVKRDDEGNLKILSGKYLNKSLKGKLSLPDDFINPINDMLILYNIETDELNELCYYVITKTALDFFKNNFGEITDDNILLLLCEMSAYGHIISIKQDDNKYKLLMVRSKDFIKRYDNKETTEMFLPLSDEIEIETITESCDIETNEEEVKQESSMLPNINELISQINHKIVGQENAIKTLISNIYSNQLLIKTGNEDLINSQKSTILLDGTTGTGKTAMIKEISSKLDIPLVIANATDFSSAGYKGRDLTDLLNNLIKIAHGDVKKAEQGIICIDEIDKLGQDNNDNNSITMRIAVQEELLAYISGSKINVEIGNNQSVMFDTSKLTFIGMGAFSNIRKQKMMKIKESNKHIGFSTSITPIVDENIDITEQDLIKNGFKREFCGRFTQYISTKTYSIDDLKTILLSSEISPLRNFLQFANSLGVKNISFDDDFVTNVATKAFEMGFGARGLQKIMNDIRSYYLLDILNGNYRQQQIFLTDDTLDIIYKTNNSSYTRKLTMEN